MGFVIFAKRNYEITLITIIIITVNGLIATTNSIILKTPL